MPAIDLARLKKQCAQLADLFDQPDEFARALHEMLDFYVNRTRRDSNAVAPSSALETYRTPAPILKHIENELGPLAASRPAAALDLADRLWDEGWLETRMLAAILLGRIPPQEQRLLPRLTAWTSQVRDPSVRAALLSTSLARLRKETPERFLLLVGEWLNPERQRLWPNGIQALLPLIRDPEFKNLPPVFDIVTHVVEAAPGTIQNELADLLDALYEASPTETIHFVRQALEESETPTTAATLRRILPLLPREMAETIRELAKARV
ncbi:MAG: DNA alkylation repair protein [Chloroflexota bacterium]